MHKSHSSSLNIIWVVALSALLQVPLSANADSLDSADVVMLEAEASQAIFEDFKRVHLFIDAEGANPKQLRDDVREREEQARAVVRKYDELSGIFGIPQLTPDPKATKGTSQEVTAWRIREDVTFESKNDSVVDAALQKATQWARVGSVVYYASPETTRNAEDHATTDAIQRFKDRAALIAKSLGASSFRIGSVNVAVKSNSSAEMKFALSSTGATSKSDSDNEQAPAINTPFGIVPGRTTITARVSGTILLQR